MDGEESKKAEAGSADPLSNKQIVINELKELYTDKKKRERAKKFAG